MRRKNKARMKEVECLLLSFFLCNLLFYEINKEIGA